jgi:hypothetical protein
MTNRTITLIAPTCTCCTEPNTLLPRDDMPGNLAVCPASGQLYRPLGENYVPTDRPPVAAPRPQTGVQIDLSRAGYA